MCCFHGHCPWGVGDGVVNVCPDGLEHFFPISKCVISYFKGVQITVTLAHSGSFWLTLALGVSRLMFIKPTRIWYQLYLWIKTDWNIHVQGIMGAYRLKFILTASDANTLYEDWYSYQLQLRQMLIYVIQVLLSIKTNAWRQSLWIYGITLPATTPLGQQPVLCV